MTTYSTYVGVDGGMTGAIAVWHPATNALRLYNIPRTIRQVNRKDHFVVDPDLLLTILALELKGVDAKVWVEAGIGEKRQAANAAYNYGFTNGGVWMAIRSLTSNAELIYPIVWKRHMMLVGKDKEASRNKARVMFGPANAHLLDKKGDHNKAEAALIARYGYNITEGKR